MMVSFKEPIYLPREIDELQLYDCRSSNLVKAQRINTISLYCLDPKELKEMAKTLKGVKFVRTSKPLINCLTSLPSTVRKIVVEGSWHKVDNAEEIVQHFPYLIEATEQFPIEAANKGKLRRIDPIMTDTKEIFKLRPRQITVESDTSVQLNDHPELFEKVKSVYISDYGDFNFDVLPSEIERIYIRDQVDIESEILNRL